MKEEKPKFQSFNDILNFLSFDYKFDTKSYGFPFNRDPKNVIFSWGQILIPKYGIREMVQNKISDIKEEPIKEITMMYQIPFVVLEDEKKFTDKYRSGVVNENISLSFRYDKTYKYGDITKSIYECCYYILNHSIETNDFFIIPYDFISDFFSYYIIPNQWGLGSTVPLGGCQDRYYADKNRTDDKFPKLSRCDCCEQWIDPIDIVDNRCPFCGATFTNELEKRETENEEHDVICKEENTENIQSKSE